MKKYYVLFIFVFSFFFSSNAIERFYTTCTLNATISIVANVSCCGGNNGSAAVVPSGGTAPYTYVWSPNGGTNDTATGLSAGIYTVTVKDSNGCLATASITITQPQCIKDSLLASPSLGCNCNGTIEVFVRGGTKPYTYLWSTGGTYDTIHNISSGEYSVKVCDSNGCCIADSVFVPKGDPISLSQTNVTCYGLCNGSATVSAWGWNGFQWSPSGGTDSTVSGLCAGTYTLTVTNLDTACSANYIFVITQPPLLTANTTVISNVSCHGGNNGSASVIASGGTPPYKYLWSPNGGSGSIATGLTVGTYTVLVTDANGCTATASVNITQPPVLSVTIIDITLFPCNLTQILDANVTGGTPPYTYSWINGSTTSSESENVDCSIYYLPYYTVNITDANGCTASDNIYLFQPVEWSGISPNITQSNVSCYGGNNGSITMLVCGSSPYFTYYWGINSATSFNSQYTASNLSAGVYEVYVTDENGCETMPEYISIIQPSALSITTDSINDNGGCNGLAWANVSGGTLPYTYYWTTGGQTTDTIKNQCAGSYCCDVTDFNGCTDSVCVIINLSTEISSILSDKGQITIYPNPNNGSFMVSMNSIPSKPEIEIYNVLGQTIYQTKIISNNTEIDLTQPQGIYFYRILNQNGGLIGYGKLIIEK